MIITKELPNKDELREDFTYSDGSLFFRYASVRAGTTIGDGYVNIKFKGHYFKAHRLIWVYHFGPIPKNMEIDHIDRNRANNKIDNLRLATHSQNQRNRTISSINTSGITGVQFHKQDNAWRSIIAIDGKMVVLKRTKDFFEACCVRKSAENKHYRR